MTIVNIIFLIFGFQGIAYSAETARNFLAYSVVEDKTIELPINLNTRGDKDASVIIFWATWCEACKTQMQLLNQEILSGHIPAGRVFAVSISESRRTIEKFAQATDFRFQFFAMPEATQVSGYFINGTPVMYLLNKNNQIMGRYQGVDIIGIKAAAAIFQETGI